MASLGWLTCCAPGQSTMSTLNQTDLDLDMLDLSRRERPFLYLASPYTQGDKDENVRISIEMADVLDRMGFEVFMPLLSHYANRICPRPYGQWLLSDFRWLSMCNCLYRMPGPSEGADREVLVAKALGIR